MTRSEIMISEGWDQNAWYVHVADYLGWDEPGFVIALTTLVVLIAVPYIIVGIMHVLRNILDEMSYKFNRSEGLAAAGWLLAMVVPAVILFTMSLIISIIGVWVGYQILKDFRDWWHKGAR